MILIFHEPNERAQVSRKKDFVARQIPDTHQIIPKTI